MLSKIFISLAFIGQTSIFPVALHDSKIIAKLSTTQSSNFVIGNHNNFCPVIVNFLFKIVVGHILQYLILPGHIDKARGPA